MDIGNKLKELRVLKGLTQEELADRSELSKGFISQLERNLTSPSITTLMDILQCLGTSIGEFFNEAPDEQIVFGKQDYFVKVDTEYKNVRMIFFMVKFLSFSFLLVLCSARLRASHFISLCLCSFLPWE